MTLASDSSKPAKSEALKLRVDSSQRELIDNAARISGKSRSAFILEAAQQAAQEALLDQVFFCVNDEQWIAFNEALERPPEKNEKLARMLGAETPWD